MLHILFTILFTAITLGFTVNKHYSGSELFSMAIFSEPESCCAENCACCNEESETIQFLVDYTFALDNFESSTDEVDLLAFALAFIISEPEAVQVKTEFIDQDLPPPDNLTALSLYQSYLL